MNKFLVLFTSLSLFFVKIDLNTVRLDYKTATQSNANVLVLYNKLKKVTKADKKVLVAYKGAVTALMAKQQNGVKAKKTFFKNGVSLLEYALKANPNNIEIRLIRLSVQQNSPKILKYNKQILEDKAFVFKHYKSVKSTSLKNFIKGYILQSDKFSEEEKALFKS